MKITVNILCTDSYLYRPVFVGVENVTVHFLFFSRRNVYLVITTMC